MFSAAYKRYALAALTSVYMVNLADRYLMNLLLQPIKEDLHLSDTQLGFVTGIAFGLFYATFGLPIARWSDRGNRVTITALAIGLWGVTVMACIFVTNYVQLVFARMSAAIGESGCKPPTYSLVGDYFREPAERTRAMSIYITGNYLSAPLTLIAGGWLNQLYGWRIAFFVMGILGLVLAVVVKLTLIEPRSTLKSEGASERPPPSMTLVLTTLWRQRSYRHLCIAFILYYTLGLGMNGWQAAFMMRSHGMNTGELGVWFGLIFGVAGVVAVLFGGQVASRWFTDERTQMRMSAVAMAFACPLYIAFLTAPDGYLALAALVPKVMVLGVFLGPIYALMQRLVPDEMRATMMAVVMLIANLIGFGIGPLTIGVLSDLLMPALERDSLRYAMLIMSFAALWASYHFWQVARTVRGDLSRSLNVGGRNDAKGYA